MASRFRFTNSFESLQLSRSIHFGETRTFFPGQLIPRVHNEIANRPRLRVEKKVSNVTNFPVFRLYVLTAHIVGALEVWVPPIGFQPRLTRAFTRPIYVWEETPHVRAAPINRPSVELVEVLLKLSRYGLIAPERWTVFYLFLCEIDVDSHLFNINAKHVHWRNQDLLVHHPVARFNHEVPNSPVFVIEEKLLGASQFAVQSLKFVSLQRIGID